MRIIWDADFKSTWCAKYMVCVYAKTCALLILILENIISFFYTYEYSLYSMLQRSFCDLVLTMYIMKL